MIHMKYITLFFLLLALCWSQAASAQGHGPNREPRWSQELTEPQRDKAKSIIDEESPRLRELRKLMREKMKELKAFTYSSDEDHDALPRLGRELQELREELRTALQALDDRLMREVGVSLRPYKGKSCVNLSKRFSPTESGDFDPPLRQTGKMLDERERHSRPMEMP